MNPKESELVLNDKGRVYHLDLGPEHIANDVILVGDPARVSLISSYFDTIEHQINHREFITHTGTYKGKRISVLATGIGTDNIDIVVNELDAAVNFDLNTRRVKPTLRSLNLIRIGTCGAVHVDLEVNETAVSTYSIGLDGVKHFYSIDESTDENRLRTAFEAFAQLPATINPPYAAAASPQLLKKFGHLGKPGITLTANGFFGPQGRSLRLPLSMPQFNEHIAGFGFNGFRIANYEMESSALFALGKGLGHQCICLCVVVANRAAGRFSKDYQPAMRKLIEGVLDGISEA